MADVNINGLGGPLASPAADDLIPVWDTSAAQTLKIRRDVFVGATITGGGTLALAGYTLTVPATGTAALVSSGTWTPALAFGATAATGTATGRYIRIGNVVHAWGRITLTSKNGGTGAAVLSGLPFASSASAIATPAAMLMISVAYVGSSFGLLAVNTKNINIYQISEAGAIGTISGGSFSDTSDIYVQVTYEA